MHGKTILCAAMVLGGVVVAWIEATPGAFLGACFIAFLLWTLAE